MAIDKPQEESTQQTTTIQKKELPKLTPKQQAFVNQIIANPLMSKTKIAKSIYDTDNDNTANVIAVENLRKPTIMAHLQENANKAERKIVNLIDSEKEEIALRASQDVLDRTFGKAKQIQEINSTGVSLNIDLTSSLNIEDV